MKKYLSLGLLFAVFCGCGLKVAKTDPVLDANGTNTTNARFVDKGDGTITDVRSGLIWLKKANITEKLITWQEAIDFCKNLDASGYSDWRLPTKDEIGSLLTGLPGNSDWRPLLEKHGFEHVQDFYWTSVEYAPDRSNAWCAPMVLGYVGIYDKEHKGYAWPVRGVMKQ